ncbi:hypothetical protein AOX59_16610 [Lentibacillus amyloliquefaciens]|uniref:Uncharacterized protein n=1 Tax=Lentibacillus amyloliquefaciens TaxID=1472767 RepID=A0A0U4DXF4_9BACI|nr:hypothetical protein AOX59_16610 [Lentibacillus amyloliquefaciens]
MKGILQAWAKKGITSITAARAEEAAFCRSRHGYGRKFSYAIGKEEVVPYWFKEQKLKVKRKQKQEREPRDLDAERELFDASDRGIPFERQPSQLERDQTQIERDYRPD